MGKFTPNDENMTKLFSALFEKLSEKMATNDVAGISLSSPQLDYPITLPYTKKQDLHPAAILEL